MDNVHLTWPEGQPANPRTAAPAWSQASLMHYPELISSRNFAFCQGLGRLYGALSFQVNDQDVVPLQAAYAMAKTSLKRNLHTVVQKSLFATFDDANPPQSPQNGARSDFCRAGSVAKGAGGQP